MELENWVERFIGLLVFVLHAAFVIGLSLRVIMQRRPVGVSLAWLSLIYLLPFAGGFLYLLLGEIRLGRRRAQRARKMYQPYADWLAQLSTTLPGRQCRISERVRPLHDLSHAMLGTPMLGGNHLGLLSEPDEILSALHDDIERAQYTCFIEFYIWHAGGRADGIVKALIRAAERGVDCRVLLDSVGSAAFFKTSWPHQMRRAGVQVVEVLPVGAWRVPFQRQDLRMHRKLVVVDDAVAYTGSMNLVDPLVFRQDKDFGQWIDVMIRAQGPIVPVMWSLFVRDWEMETGERLLEQQEHRPHFWHDHNHRVQMIPSGPFLHGDSVHQILLLAIYQAQDTVVLTTPYFVPDAPLVAALCSAAQRGICVKIILPDRNDSIMVHYASNAFMDDLLHAGVEVYRFASGLLHTKSILVDDQLALVGTLNLDGRSLWLNFEVTLLVDSPEFCVSLAQLQHDYLEQAHRLDARRWQQRPTRTRILENFFYLFSPLL